MSEYTSPQSAGWRFCEVQGCHGVKLRWGDRCLAHVKGIGAWLAMSALSVSGQVDARGVVITSELFDRILKAVPKTEGVPTFGSSSFRGAVFQDDIDLRGAIFEKPVAFVGASFAGHILLDRAVFKHLVWFDKAEFALDASFTETRFNNTAYYNNASFGLDAGFKYASFDGLADFSGANFNWDSSFENSTFHEQALFPRASFDHSVSFKGAKFNRDVFFERTVIGSLSSFEGAIFKESAVFASIFEKDLTGSSQLGMGSASQARSSSKQLGSTGSRSGDKPNLTALTSDDRLASSSPASANGRASKELIYLNT